MFAFCQSLGEWRLWRRSGVCRFDGAFGQKAGRATLEYQIGQGVEPHSMEAAIWKELSQDTSVFYSHGPS